MWLFRILAVAGVLYLGVAGLMYAFQSRLVHLPSIPGRTLVADPGDIGLAHESVALTTADGVGLHGWFVPAEGASHTLLFFHGNAGNISHRLGSLRIWHDLGVDVLIIDYRGYGRSEGRPSEAGLYRDADAAWRYLREARDVPPERIVAFGRSLGGAVAACLAAERALGGLILESTFRSVPELGADLYPWLPVRWLARLDYDTEACLEHVDAPVLVVHSEDDEIIPFSHGQALAQRAGGGLLRLRGDHNTGFLRSEGVYRRGLAEFLASLARE